MSARFPSSGLFPADCPADSGYLQSVIRSNDYAELLGQRPLSWQLRFQDRADSEAWIQSFPGYNTIDATGLASELQDIGPRPFFPFFMSAEAPQVAAHEDSPFYPMVLEAIQAGDALDAVGRMISWLKERITYQINDLPRDPETVLREGFGDCDDFGRILEMVCGWVGLECPLTYGAFYEPDLCGVRGWPPHAWNMLKVGDVFVPIDTTLGNPETRVTGDWLWQVARENVWIPFTAYGMEHWNEIAAISPSEAVETIDFDSVASTPQDIHDVLRHLNASSVDLRNFLIGENYRSQVYLIDGLIEDIPNAALTDTHHTHYRTLYLEHVLSLWLGDPYMVSDPLTALKKMEPVFPAYASTDCAKPLQGMVLALLSHAIGQAEDERLAMDSEIPIFNTATAMNANYRVWRDLLQMEGGYADLFFAEWEKRLVALYRWDGLEPPPDLQSGLPEYAPLLTAVAWIHDERTPDSLRSETEDYIRTRNLEQPDLTRDAALMRDWREDLAFRRATPEDREQLTRLYETMIGSETPEDLSLVALIELRRIAGREMARSRSHLGAQDDLTALTESLAWYTLARTAKLDEPVIGEIGRFQDTEALANAEGARTSSPRSASAFSKTMAMSYSMSHIRHQIAEHANDLVSKEALIKASDETTLGEFKEEAAILSVIAHKLYLQESAAAQPNDPARYWISSYEAVSGNNVSLDTRFSWDYLVLFLPEPQTSEDLQASLTQASLSQVYPNQTEYSLRELLSVLAKS